MSGPVSQNHFTLSFPINSPADAKLLAEQLPPMMPLLFQAADAIGRVHYSRFTILSERTLLFLGDFDGEFGPLMADLAGHAGAVFDTIFAHVENPPPTPVADNAEAFVEWAAEHLLHPAFVYTAYTDATVKQIKALAAAADVKGASQPNIFLVILPSKARVAFAEMQMIVRTMGMVGKVRRDLDKVGTPHFAQFVPLEDRQLGFFTDYDGSFENSSTISRGTSGKSLTFSSSSPRARPPRRAENTFRSSVTLPRRPTEPLSASTRPIPA